MNKLILKKQSVVSKLADICMLPCMFLLQGSLSESPQRTHRWNNTKLSASAIHDFDSSDMVTVTGDVGAKRRWVGPIPLFHIPVFGGWDEFVVLEPRVPQSEWFVGWLPYDTIGVSQIGLTGQVRVLVGPRPVQFFGVDATGYQIPVIAVAKGKVGKAGGYRKVPLL